MRISDWSSDMCSSDLVRGAHRARQLELLGRAVDHDDPPCLGQPRALTHGEADPAEPDDQNGLHGADLRRVEHGADRSETSRAGDECVSKCLSRWVTEPTYKQNLRNTINSQQHT